MSLTVAELGTIACVWAHPDDETYLSAGIMAQAVENGQRVVCVTATKGELGSQDAERWPLATLAEVREAELMTALSFLGVEDHRWLDYPDGGCEAIPDDDATEKVEAILAEVGADTVLTFGPDGQTGHPDHIAVCRWATSAAARTGAAVYYSTVTPEWWEGPGAFLAQYDVWFAGNPSITAPEELAINFELSDELLERKYSAIAAQVSQSEGLLANVGKEFFFQWTREETYRHP
jgi:LmbE family N-acetylglucosaminyl deacetylase